MPYQPLSGMDRVELEGRIPPYKRMKITAREKRPDVQLRICISDQFPAENGSRLCERHKKLMFNKNARLKQPPPRRPRVDAKFLQTGGAIW
jgi:hypothetical protein